MSQPTNTSSTNTSSTTQWTGVQAYTLAVVCLLLGMAGGWLVRGSQSPTTAAAVETASAPAPAPTGMGGAMNAQPTPEQLKMMADKLLEAAASEDPATPGQKAEAAHRAA